MAGVDAGQRNSIKEVVLLKAAKRKEDLEHLRFVCLIKAMNTDYTDRPDVLKLNNLLSQYYDVLEPKRLIDRKKFTVSSEDTMKSFNTYFAKVKANKKQKKKEQPKVEKTKLKSFDKL